MGTADKRHRGHRQRCVGCGAAWGHGRSGQPCPDRKVRTVVTDDQGRYNIVDLRPGTYALTFTLAGFNALKRVEASNLNDDLRARGLTTVSKILKIYDAGVNVGGPIRKDKLWFFGSFREWGNGHLMAGNFWNKTQGTPFYTPDLLRPGDRYQWYESKAARVTCPGGAAVFDLYNVFNGSGVVQVNNAYGSQWRQPTEVQDPRIVQFSAQLSF